MLRTKPYECASEANFHFRGTRLFQIGGTFGRFATTDVIQISTTRATFTERVVPIQKHIALFLIPSISGTKTVKMKLTKKPAVKLSDLTHITYLLSISLASCNLTNGFRRFIPHIIRAINQSSTP